MVREATTRGHEVVSVSRSAPKAAVPGVRYERGDVAQVAEQVISGTDVVVAALSPRGETAGRLVDEYANLARRTGSYRVGDEIALFDADGKSAISGEDFALAIVDEIENPARHRAHIGIAY